MKIKIIEYKINKGNKVRVHSHNRRKGKWKKNPKFEWHKKIFGGETVIQFGLDKRFSKEYEIEVKE
jgi:hypothetical protein